MEIELYVLSGFAIALSLVAVGLARFVLYKQKKFAGPKGQELGKLLTEIKKGNLKIKQDYSELFMILEKLSYDSKKHFNHVDLKHYNVFEGKGAQSFSLVILDEQKSGMVLTGINNQGGYHLYPKVIKEGKSEQRLTEEEKNLLN